MPQNPLNLVVLVSGNGSNLQAIIDAMQHGMLKSQIKCVISNVPNIMALDRAQKAGIPTQVVSSKGVEKEEFQNNLLQTVVNAKPDLIVLAGFMKILSKEFVHAFKDRIINIHPALLPKFPGLKAVRQALDAKVNETGCTVHLVDEGCDTGPILVQKKVPVLKNDTEETLHRRIQVEEHKAIVEAVKLFEGQNNFRCFPLPSE